MTTASEISWIGPAGTFKTRARGSVLGVRHVRGSSRVPSVDVSRAQPTQVTMKRGDHLPTRVLDGTPGRQQVGGVGDKTCVIEPSQVLALSPARGAMTRIVAAVPERIQEHYIGRSERLPGRAILAQAGMTPPEKWPRGPPGKWPGLPGNWPRGLPANWPRGPSGRWPPGMAEVRLRRGRSS